ncbi:hypothetical protein AB0C10_11785 [Microbispora amethystogenes]|uniref:hypothetical protein n=1 Tax=Microbispora amethystogenes TaxID=1427754 RepID=UPI003404A240
MGPRRCRLARGRVEASGPGDGRPPALLSSRALLLVFVSVQTGVTVTVSPALALPIGVALTTLALLHKLTGS